VARPQPGKRADEDRSSAMLAAGIAVYGAGGDHGHRHRGAWRAL